MTTVPFGTTVIPDVGDGEAARQVVLVVQADPGPLGLTTTFLSRIARWTCACRPTSVPSSSTESLTVAHECR